jgi:hypothetical protein
VLTAQKDKGMIPVSLEEYDDDDDDDDYESDDEEQHEPICGHFDHDEEDYDEEEDDETLPRKVGRKSASMKNQHMPTVHLRPAHAVCAREAIPKLFKSLPPLDRTIVDTVHNVSSDELLQMLLEIPKCGTAMRKDEAMKVGYAVGTYNKVELTEAMLCIAKIRRPAFCAELADILIKGASEHRGNCEADGELQDILSSRKRRLQPR